MATQIPANPNLGTPMTEEALKALVLATAKEAVGPAVKEALEPLTKADGEFMRGLSAAINVGAKEETFDDKVLGKHPYGRKAAALALAALEGVDQKDIVAVGKLAAKHWNASAGGSVEKWAQHHKGLTVGSATSAGALVFPDYDPEWIELLRNNAVVRGLARTVPMPRGAMTKRRQTSAATAAYQGELGPIAQTSQQVGLVNLSYKKLTAATVVSNDLIRYGGPFVDQFVQEDLIRVSALREDRAFLVGNPPTDAGSPTGIRFQTAAGNIAATAGTSLANFQTDFTNLIKLVEKSNIQVNPGNAGFILSPSTFWTVYALTTTTGDWMFKAGLEQAQPTILGYPVYKTTQLEISNSWMGAASGLYIFAHFPSLQIHDSMQRMVEAFRGGAYHDGSTVQSGISNDETVITAISEHDFLQVYDVAASIRTGAAQ